jgi:phosphoglycerate dehydrogenase-like enzyme
VTPEELTSRLAVLPTLQAVIIPFAGPTPPMRQALAAEMDRRRRSGAPALMLFNSHHNAPMTAEMAIALLLACAKRLLPADAALRRGDWSHRGLPLPGGPTPPPPPLPALTLDGRRAVVVGLGAVGKRVAASCAALGMEVHSTSRSATSVGRLSLERPQVAIMVHPSTKLRELLAHPRTAAVLLCAPETADTARRPHGLQPSTSVVRSPSWDRAVQCVCSELTV